MTQPGCLYGVGLGPGDPELMTLKAARILREARVIAYFSKGGKRSHAHTIAASMLNGHHERNAAGLSGNDRISGKRSAL